MLLLTACRNSGVSPSSLKTNSLMPFISSSVGISCDPFAVVLVDVEFSRAEIRLRVLVSICLSANFCGVCAGNPVLGLTLLRP